MTVTSASVEDAAPDDADTLVRDATLPARALPDDADADDEDEPRPAQALRFRISDGASDLVSFEASPATEPLYTVNPFAEEGLAALFVTHPPLERRLALLRGIAR